MSTSLSNRLATESSPYLLQHADNPVHWQPWDDQALAYAAEQDKPILLSIGYSACHWCHVMARESFADDSTAQVMNDNFVNIKVDREERPDLDKIYQSALHLLSSQGGGWPLTLFLDPQTLVPFYGGTYFPKGPQYQLPGFVDAMLRITEAFDTKREELNTQGEQIKSTLAQLVPPVLDASMADAELLQAARDQLGELYDDADGGFGRSPKFPMPSALDRVLRHWAYVRRSGGMDKQGLDIVMISLTQMARGGIYDHVGGGFCRYATDKKWMIPHFEKMLYDNAQLLSLYADALKFGADELFEDAITETIEWLMREMRDPGHGFYSSIDADSEGEEGKFYVWRKQEVKKLLNSEQYDLIETLYGLDKPTNFENKWNFHRHDSWRSVCDRLSLEQAPARGLLLQAKRILFNERATRQAPGIDDKVLTGWNGLLVKGLANASRQLDRADWSLAAQQIVDFIQAELYIDKTLYATWRNGRAKQRAFLDDYANLLDGLADLLTTQWRDSDAQFARRLADQVIEDFYDRENGGFYFISDKHEQLIAQAKPSMDEALPPGNATLAIALLKLGHLFAHTEYLDVAEHTLRWVRAIAERVPSGHCNILTALEMTVYPPEQVILRGPVDQMKSWCQQIDKGYTPWRTVYSIPYEGGNAAPAYLPRLVSAEQQQRVTAFVCSGLQCSLPISDVEELKEALH